MPGNNILEYLKHAEIDPTQYNNFLHCTGSTAATTGYLLHICNIATHAVASTEFCKGAVFQLVGGAANSQLWTNEGDGYGSATSFDNYPT